MSLLIAAAKALIYVDLKLRTVKFKEAKKVQHPKSMIFWRKSREPRLGYLGAYIFHDSCNS